MSDLGKILKARRSEAGLSQAQLAERAGISKRTIQGWEAGKTSDLERFVAALAALGYDMGSLTTPVNGRRPRGRPRKTA